MKRYSKKRQAIIDCLASTDEHPSAEWVYNKLKPQFPDLSLATVYRNINELKNEGRISSVGIVFDKERFDANTKPHTHAVCVRCGKIIDVGEVKLPPEVIDSAQKLTEFSISYADLRLVGICEECRKKETN